MISLLFLTLALLAATPPSTQAPDFTILEQTVLDEIAKTGTPGAAVAVVQDGRVVFSRGFGVASIETGAAVTPDTLFRVGSVTKMLTAAAAVTLAEEGKLDLEAPVGRKLKGLSPRVGEIALHQLLCQTSGLKEVPGGDSDAHGDDDLDGFARSLKDSDVLVPPGTAFSYSNAGYALAGLVLAAERGKPYAEVMNEIVFQPLGMIRTTLRPTVAMTYPLAARHEAKDGGPPFVVRPLADDSRLWPAGYAFTSANDLARFVGALLDGGQVDGRQALPKAVSARLLTPHVPIPTSVFRNGAYGYGLVLQDDRGLRRAEHGGQLPGYSAEIRTFPERRVGVIVLANRGNVRFNKTFDKAFDLLLGEKLAAESPPQPAEMTMTEEEMLSYVGHYTNRGSMDLHMKGGRLYLERGGTEMPVTKIGERRFSVTPEGIPPQEFLIVPSSEGRPGYIQMFVWVYRKD